MTEPTETGPNRETPTATADGDLWPTAAVEAGSAGDRIGPYRILETLGEGGMGTVFLAEQTGPIRRRVAVKLIRARRIDSREALLRFQAERQALARMSHPAIAQVFDAGSTPDGKPFIVMEYVPGEPIHTYCDRRSLDVNARLELFIAVCEGVQHAHQKGVIHRDLKPSNILVTEEQGRPLPKIIDFGIAKALGEPLADGTLVTGPQLLGTPAYISPEAIAGEPGADLDTRSDVYSLGVVLYELLVGVPPFDPAGRAVAQLVRAVSEEAPRPSTRVQTLDHPTRERVAAARRANPMTLGRFLRRDLDWVILKALARDRAERYPSAAALAEDLGRHLRREPVQAGPPTATYRLAKFVRRHTAAVVAAAVAVLALVLGLVGTTVTARRASHEAARANREAAAAREVSAFLVDLFQVSDPGRARGATVTARELLDAGAARVERELSDQPLTRATLMETIGTVYRKLGLYDEAAPLLEGALRLREAGGLDPLELASTLLAVSVLERERGRYDTAELLARRCLEIRERALGPNHPDVGDVLSSLGLVELRRGRYAEGEATLRRALAIRERALGPDHPGLGPALNNLAMVLKHQARYAEAEGLYRRDLGLAERALGPDHPDLAVTLNNLAIVCRRQGRLDEAEPLMVRALAIREKALGPGHPEVANSLNDLAALAWNRGRLGDARTLFERALAIREQALGPDHPDLGRSLCNLGTLAAVDGRKADAEALFERSLAVFERSLPAGHPDLAQPLHGLANLWRDRGRLDDAEPAYRRCLELLEPVLRPDHPELDELRRDYATLLRSLGRESEAAALTSP